MVVGRAFKVGDPELIIKTTDAGQTWFRQDRGIGRQLWSVFFSDELHGWAVGENGTIFATTNGGVTFVPQDVALPEKFHFRQNYPNPFNPRTTIEFSLPFQSRVKLSVYNVLGQLSGTLVDEVMDARSYREEFDSMNLSSGVYFYRLEVVKNGVGTNKTFVDVRKMVIIR